MSDIAEFGIGVDFMPVTAAQKALLDLDNAFGKTVANIVRQEKQLTAARKAEASVQIKAVEDIANKRIALENKVATEEQNIWAKAQRTRLSMMAASEQMAQKEVQATIKQRDAIEALGKAYATSYQSKINSAMGVGSSATSGGAGFSAIEASLEQLRLKYDRVYVAEKLFVAQQTELKSAILNEVGDVGQLQTKLQQLETEYSKIGSSTKNTAEAFIRNNALGNQSKSMYSGLGFAVQQTGYQVGDFLVQIQSGANPLMAFGQQATQLVYILPSLAEAFNFTKLSLMGMSLGIGTLTTILGIGIPLLTAIGATFMKSGEGAKSGSEGVDIYKEAMKSLTEEIKKNNEESLKTKFGTDSFGVASASQQIDDLTTKIESMTATVERMKSYGGKSAQFANINDTTAELEKQRGVLQEQLNILKAQAEAEKMLKGYMSASSAVQAKLVSDKAEALAKTREQVIEEQKAADKATFLKNVFHAMAGEASAVSVSLNDWPGKIAAAIGPASALANYMHQISVGAGMMGRGLPALPGGPKSFGVGGIEVLPGSETPGGIKPSNKPDFSVFEGTGKGSGGGAGGGGNTALDTLIESLKTQQETVDEWFKAGQDSLQSASDKELQIIGGRHEAELRLEEEHQKRLSEIKDSSQNKQLNDAGTFFGGMADLAKIGGEKTSKAVKAFSAAQALTNSYLAFTQVLADPSLVGRPWARFGLAASALASGLSAVASINSGSKGSISSGGGSSAETTPTAITSSQAAPQQVLIQGIKPTDLFTGEQLSTLFDSFYKENRNRGMVFQVAR